MTYKFEDKDGVKSYTLNGKVYDKLEDVPPEFQSFFKDDNQNGISDQIEEVFGSDLNSISPKGLFKSLLNQYKTGKVDVKPSEEGRAKNQPTYDRMDGGGSPILTLLKISVAIFIVLAIIYAGMQFSKADTDLNSDDVISGEKGIPSTTIPAEADIMTFRIQDPNEPPYKMFVEAVLKDNVVFTFDMPNGELEDSSNDRIMVMQEGEGNTNVVKQNFNIIASNGDCDLTPNKESDLQWKKIKVGNNDFYQGIEASQIAGNAASVYSYALSKQGHCITFMLEVAYDTPTEFQQAFDEQEKILQLERLLLSIKYQSEIIN